MNSQAQLTKECKLLKADYERLEFERSEETFSPSALLSFEGGSTPSSPAGPRCGTGKAAYEPLLMAPCTRMHAPSSLEAGAAARHVHTAAKPGQGCSSQESSQVKQPST